MTFSSSIRRGSYTTPELTGLKLAPAVSGDAAQCYAAARHHASTSSTEALMRMRVTKNLGMLLLGIWLILTGLLPLLHMGLGELSIVMELLAIVAGALILLGR